MDEILALSGDLPEVVFEAGHTFVREGEPSAALWILVSGHLIVEKNGVLVNTVNTPGALIGEVSALLGRPPTATVTTAARTVLRQVDDPDAFLASQPQITRLVAVGLAERLNFVTTYLADLKRQYGDAPGLAMIPEVLRRLADGASPPAAPGSRRDPDPGY